jgi:hypothetical protein
VALSSIMHCTVEVMHSAILAFSERSIFTLGNSSLEVVLAKYHVLMLQWMPRIRPLENQLSYSSVLLCPPESLVARSAVQCSAVQCSAVQCSAGAGAGARSYGLPEAGHNF